MPGSTVGAAPGSGGADLVAKRSQQFVQDPPKTRSIPEGLLFEIVGVRTVPDGIVDPTTHDPHHGARTIRSGSSMNPGSMSPVLEGPTILRQRRLSAQAAIHHGLDDDHGPRASCRARRELTDAVGRMGRESIEHDVNGLSKLRLILINEQRGLSQGPMRTKPTALQASPMGGAASVPRTGSHLRAVRTTARPRTERNGCSRSGRDHRQGRRCHPPRRRYGGLLPSRPARRR
jgi:hypothetical protein